MTQLQKGSAEELDKRLLTDPILDIFVNLIAYNTQANPENKASPSSIGQLRLGAYLLKQINEKGYEVTQNTKGAIIVKVPASLGFENCKRLCLLAHLDTACDASGENVNPRLVTNYKGGGIELDNGLVINESISSEIEDHIGDDIVVTDGTTLLGGDDKAGVAVLMHLLETLASDKDIKHGPLTIIFTVDEEIGRSSQCITLDEIDSDFAITVDGCDIGELDVATFNAKGAIIEIEGRVVHTACAYKKMVNAIEVATDLIKALPQDEKPENTKDLDGFYHVHTISGEVQKAKVKMILRDFDEDVLDKRVTTLLNIVKDLNAKIGYECVKARIEDQYKNMANVLKEHPDILNWTKEAFELSNVTIKENYVRGGTDGSHLSSLGVPCPNIFTGALNCHGPYECLPVQSLHKSYEVVLNLVQIIANKSK